MELEAVRPSQLAAGRRVNGGAHPYHPPAMSDTVDDEYPAAPAYDELESIAPLPPPPEPFPVHLLEGATCAAPVQVAASGDDNAAVVQDQDDDENEVDAEFDDTGSDQATICNYMLIDYDYEDMVDFNLVGIQRSCAETLGILLPQSPTAKLSDEDRPLAAALSDLLEASYELETFHPSSAISSPTTPVEDQRDRISPFHRLEHVLTASTTAATLRAEVRRQRQHGSGHAALAATNREELAWSRVEALSNSVIQLVRERSERDQVPLRSPGGSLPPMYRRSERAVSDDSRSLSSLPAYDLHERDQVLSDADDNGTTSGAFGMTTAGDAKNAAMGNSKAGSMMRGMMTGILNDLDTVTHAIERLQFMAPRMQDQRVELRPGPSRRKLQAAVPNLTPPQTERERMLELEDLWDKMDRFSGSKRSKGLDDQRIDIAEARRQKARQRELAELAEMFDDDIDEDANELDEDGQPHASSSKYRGGQSDKLIRLLEQAGSSRMGDQEHRLRSRSEQRQSFIESIVDKAASSRMGDQEHPLRSRSEQRQSFIDGIVDKTQSRRFSGQDYPLSLQQMLDGRKNQHRKKHVFDSIGESTRSDSPDADDRSIGKDKGRSLSTSPNDYLYLHRELPPAPGPRGSVSVPTSPRASISLPTSPRLSQSFDEHDLFPRRGHGPPSFPVADSDGDTDGDDAIIPRNHILNSPTCPPRHTPIRTSSLGQLHDDASVRRGGFDENRSPSFGGLCPTMSDESTGVPSSSRAASTRSRPLTPMLGIEEFSGDADDMDDDDIDNFDNLIHNRSHTPTAPPTLPLTITKKSPPRPALVAVEGSSAPSPQHWLQVLSDMDEAKKDKAGSVTAMSVRASSVKGSSDSSTPPQTPPPVPTELYKSANKTATRAAATVDSKPTPPVATHTATAAAAADDCDWKSLFEEEKHSQKNSVSDPATPRIIETVADGEWAIRMHDTGSVRSLRSLTRGSVTSRTSRSPHTPPRTPGGFVFSEDFPVESRRNSIIGSQQRANQSSPQLSISASSPFKKLASIVRPPALNIGRKINRNKAPPTPVNASTIGYVTEHQENLRIVQVLLMGGGFTWASAADLQVEVVGPTQAVLLSKTDNSLRVPVVLPTPVIANQTVSVHPVDDFLEAKLAALPTLVETPSLNASITHAMSAPALRELAPRSLCCTSCDRVVAHLPVNVEYKDLPSEHWGEMLEVWMCHADPAFTAQLAKLTKDGFWPQQDTVLVGGSYLLIAGSHICDPQLVLEKSNDPDQWRIVTCPCGEVLGRLRPEDGQPGAGTVRFSKWAIALLHGAGPGEIEPVRYPVSTFAVSDMLELAQAHASHRFIICDEQTGDRRLAMWVFNPSVRIAYKRSTDKPPTPLPLPLTPLEREMDHPSSISSSALSPRNAVGVASESLPLSHSLRAAKIMFKVLEPYSPEANFEHLPGFGPKGQVEHLRYSRDVCNSLIAALRASYALFPARRRTLGAFDVGFLERI